MVFYPSLRNNKKNHNTFDSQRDTYNKTNNKNVKGTFRDCFGAFSYLNVFIKEFDNGTNQEQSDY